MNDSIMKCSKNVSETTDIERIQRQEIRSHLDSILSTVSTFSPRTRFQQVFLPDNLSKLTLSNKVGRV